MKIVLTLLFLVTPILVFGAGIVPCDGTAASGVVCEGCQLVKLGQNIITWLISIVALLGAIVFAWAGFKMLTSGGNSGQISQAKEMMTNVVIGIVILLAGWLIIDTVMKLFVDTAKIGPWNQIQCVPQPAGTPTPPGGVVATTTTACAYVAPAPFTPEPASPEWANTDPMLQACANKFTGLSGGRVTSAYRSSAYQTHLYDNWSMWCKLGLQSNDDPQCASVKATVSGEISRHKLSCNLLVAQSASNHTSGRAIDVEGIAHGSAAVLDAAKKSCLVWFGASDAVHYTLQSSCTYSCP